MQISHYVDAHFSSDGTLRAHHVGATLSKPLLDYKVGGYIGKPLRYHRVDTSILKKIGLTHLVDSTVASKLTRTHLVDSYVSKEKELSHHVNAGISPKLSFKTAFEQSSMTLKAKVDIEFGSNRFNLNQTVTASSKKLTNKVDGQAKEFWTPGDAFNNKDRHAHKWLVCDRGIKLRDKYRTVNLTDKDIEKGWWSANKSDASGIFTTPEWVQAVFDARTINKAVLFSLEGYKNMKKVTLQYRRASDSVWVDIVTNAVLPETQYRNEWTFSDVSATGLKVIISETYAANDFARVSEFQAYFTTTISDDIVSMDVDMSREEYDGSVPIGIFSSNVLSMELDNIDQKYSLDNASSPYYPYLTQENKLTAHYGIEVSPGTYEYVKMGEFWSDDWEASGDSMVASVTARDYSKYLQKEQFTIGLVWQKATLAKIFTDIMHAFGKGADELDIDYQASDRVFDIAYVKDQTVWDFMREIAFADQGVFGFDREGRFYYHSYTRLDREPYNQSLYTFSHDTNIINARNRTAIYINKILIDVQPVSDQNVGESGIWGAENPTVLSWNKLANSINSTDTTIVLTHDAGPADTSDHLLPERSGYIAIGNELIKYKKRDGKNLTDCKRGYAGTQAASHAANTYVGEARYWTIEYDKSPAVSVSHPLISAIDNLKKEGYAPQAKVLLFEYSAFNAKLAVANIVEYKTILEGSGRSMYESGDLPWFCMLKGVVPVEGVSREKIGIDIDEESGLANENYIRLYGKNEFTITNRWIQDKEHALDIGDIFIQEYGVPRKILDMEAVGYPELDTADRVTINNYPQLSISNKQYHIIGIRYKFDGGLQGTYTLREVKS